MKQAVSDYYTNNYNSMGSLAQEPEADISNDINYKYKYKISVIWSESTKPNYTAKDEERIITGEICFEVKPSTTSELKEKILEQILEKYSCEKAEQPIRQPGATLVIEIPDQIKKNEYEVKGTLSHPKINLPKDYEYIFCSMEDWIAVGLTISNRYGRIEFIGRVNCEEVDFSKEIQILKTSADIYGELENYETMITLKFLPPKVANELNNYRKARELMD